MGPHLFPFRTEKVKPISADGTAFSRGRVGRRHFKRVRKLARFCFVPVLSWRANYARLQLLRLGQTIRQRAYALCHHVGDSSLQASLQSLRRHAATPPVNVAVLVFS